MLSLQAIIKQIIYLLDNTCHRAPSFLGRTYGFSHSYHRCSQEILFHCLIVFKSRRSEFLKLQKQLFTLNLNYTRIHIGNCNLQLKSNHTWPINILVYVPKRPCTLCTQGLLPVQEWPIKDVGTHRGSKRFSQMRTKTDKKEVRQYAYVRICSKAANHAATLLWVCFTEVAYFKLDTAWISLPLLLVDFCRYNITIHWFLRSAADDECDRWIPTWIPTSVKLHVSHLDSFIAFHQHRMSLQLRMSAQGKGGRRTRWREAVKMHIFRRCPSWMAPYSMHTLRQDETRWLY